MQRLSLVSLLLWATASAPGCTTVGGVSDGTSLSFGWSNRGELVGAVELPPRGDGYLMPSTWATRGNNWGTEELVGLIVRAARRVRGEQHGAQLYVADLSPRLGGASTWHRSHQTGRDADLIFFALDEQGRPAPPPATMQTYDATGMTAALDGKGRPLPRRRFDVERNWLLVRALLEDPATQVQFLFIYAPLRQMLLDHAIASGEPPELVERASALLNQPADSLPHDDHLHVRIYCPASDRSLGCHDRGPQRWLKKDWKYAALRSLPPSPMVQVPQVGPMCRLLPAALLAGR